MTKFIKILLLTISLGFTINLANISASHALFEKGICVSKTYGSKINVKYSYSGKCKDFGTLFISKNDYPSYQGKKYSGFDGSGANKKYGTTISISSMMNRYRSDEVINKVYKNFDYYKKNKNYDFYIIDLSTFNIGKFKNGEFIADSKIDQKKLNFCADIFYGKEALEDGYFTDADSCPLETNTYQIADKIKWDFDYSINFSKAYLDQKSFYINTTGTYSIFLGKKQTDVARKSNSSAEKKIAEFVKTESNKKIEDRKSLTQRINISNCREVNALTGKIRFLNNNEGPILFKNININFNNKKIEFEKNKDWISGTDNKKIYKTNFKYGSEDNILLSNVVGIHMGVPTSIKINYDLGIVEQGQNQQMKLICEKINNTKTQFAKLFDGNSLIVEETEIAKKEPSKPQKKIAKTNNSNQNKTIKKKVNADKEAPVIEIADTITVKDTTYEIAGMVKDKSDTVYIEIDGQTILAENGKFKFQKYSPVDHQLQIVAIDQWGNRSEPKMVDVKINIQVAGTSNVIEPLNPSKLRAKIDRNKVALVIGVEKYENSPSAKYASLDAKYFKDYARKVFGVREDNINLLTDEEANLSKTNSAFFKWLPSKIKSNQTDLIIFYAGHGLASTDGKEKYILPFNADPDLLSRTAISRNEIFDQIISLNPRSVTIFFDTCYSGVSRDEQMLLASARPLRVIADDEEQLPDNFTIFSASKNDQISSGLSDAKHGIFSYFLMKGLEGKADLNGDRKLTNNELLTYLDDNVSEKALDLGRQQNPTLSGNPEQVLARY